MDKLTKDQIIMEFEIATQYKSKEVSIINVEVLKKAVKYEYSMNRYYIETCLKLMQILTKELKLKNTIQHKEVEILSEDEKHFLALISKQI